VSSTPLPAPVVSVRGVSKAFPGSAQDEGDRLAVADVTFAVGPGEILCVVGKTGCGKSTLVNLLLGLERPSSGEILIDGKSPADDFMGLHRSVAAVFQTDRLLPWRTVIDNAALGLEAAGEPREKRHAAARPWLARVGLAGWENHFPHQLSGGMRQRVALARAFVLEPTVVLLDEAFGHLDEVTAQQLRQQCLSLISETQKAAIVVTHSITEALEIGTQLLVLGRPAKVLRNYDLAELRARQDWFRKSPVLRDEIFRVIEEHSGS
jgi:NitT/TauT family transport system ATP-binding protein